MSTCMWTWTDIESCEPTQNLKYAINHMYMSTCICIWTCGGAPPVIESWNNVTNHMYMSTFISICTYGAALAVMKFRTACGHPHIHVQKFWTCTRDWTHVPAGGIIPDSRKRAMAWTCGQLKAKFCA